LPRLQYQAGSSRGWIPFDLVVAEGPAGVVTIANGQSPQSLQENCVVFKDGIAARHSAYAHPTRFTDNRRDTADPAIPRDLHTGIQKLLAQNLGQLVQGSL